MSSGNQSPIHMQAGNQSGIVTVDLYFDPATGNLNNSGPNGQCLVANNQTNAPYPVTLETVEGGQTRTFTRSLPVGLLDFTAQQIAAVGITNKSQFSLSL